MNSREEPTVEYRASRTLCVIAVAIALSTIGTIGCVEVKGGAVELSWTLRDFEGEANNCRDARIGQVRVCWREVADAGDTPGGNQCVIIRNDAGFTELFRTFDCEQNRGVTTFEVPPGRQALFVVPLCDDGSLPSGPFQVPAPIVRTVEEGRVVTLNQLLIIASDVDCQGEECTCP